MLQRQVDVHEENRAKEEDERHAGEGMSLCSSVCNAGNILVASSIIFTCTVYSWKGNPVQEPGNSTVTLPTLQSIYGNSCSLRSHLSSFYWPPLSGYHICMEFQQGQILGTRGSEKPMSSLGFVAFVGLRSFLGRRGGTTSAASAG